MIQSQSSSRFRVAGILVADFVDGFDLMFVRVMCAGGVCMGGPDAPLVEQPPARALA